MGMMLLLLPAMVAAEGDQINAGPPPIGQPLVREGDFAVKLTEALSLGRAETEIEAENQLSEVGISPKNGWIADYPVTPDIIDELYKAVREAATSGKIPLSVDAALQKMHDVVSQSGLSIEMQSGENTAELPGPQSSPSPTVINNYYQTEGPPTVTYYAPPPDYYNLYGWVPFPFWYSGIWFPGFFILHDFHRTVFIDNRAVFVSNHFKDIRRHRITRIDPVTRFHGSTISNSGVIRTRGGTPAFEPSRERAITNQPRMQTVPNSPAIRPSSRPGAGVTTIRNNSAAIPPVSSGATLGTSSFRENRSTDVRTRSDVNAGTINRGNTMSNSPSRSARFVNAPRGESSIAPSTSSSRGFSMPNRGSRVFSLPSRSGGSDGMPFRGSNIGGGRGRR